MSYYSPCRVCGQPHSPLQHSVDTLRRDPRTNERRAKKSERQRRYSHLRKVHS